MVWEVSTVTLSDNAKKLVPFGFYEMKLNNICKYFQYIIYKLSTISDPSFLGLSIYES